MNAKEKERRINNIRLRATILKSLVLDLEKTGDIDMRPEMINFFNDSIGVFEEEEEEENESKNIG